MILLIFFVDTVSADTQTNTLETFPTGAEVLNSKNTFLGKTPFDLSLLKNRTDTIKEIVLNCRIGYR